MRHNRFDRICAGAVCALALVTTLVAAGPAAAVDKTKSELSRRLESMTPEDQQAFLRDALANGDVSAEVYFQMGNTFFALDQLDSAIVYYERAIEGDPASSKAWVNMGLAYDSQRQPNAAERAFREALKVDAKDVLAMCHLGFNLFSHGQTNEAIDYYLRALAIDPESAQAHYNLGLAFADARIFGEALLEWEKVIELDNDELGKTAAENVELIRTYMELDGK